MVPKKMIPALLLLLSCQSPPSMSGDFSDPSLQDGLTCEWNEPHTFQLCKREPQESDRSFPNPFVFEIYDKAGNLVMKKEMSAGYAKWVGDTDVEYFQPPGMMPQGVDRDDLVQVYRIRSKETISKKEYLSQREP